MNVFEFREALVGDYASYIRGFRQIRDPRVRERVETELGSGRLWPELLIQLNPAFEPGERIDGVVARARIFRRKSGRCPTSRTAMATTPIRLPL